MKHYVCDLLGVQRNRYGVSSRAFEKLVWLMLQIKYDDATNNELREYLKTNGLYDRLANALDGERDPSPSENSIYNFVFARYFERHDTPIAPEEVDSWQIPLKLLSEKPSDIYDLLFVCKYNQTRPIPRKVIQNWGIAEDYIKAKCEEYEIGMLDDPFTDDDAMHAS